MPKWKTWVSLAVVLGGLYVIALGLAALFDAITGFGVGGVGCQSAIIFVIGIVILGVLGGRGGLR